MGFLHNTQKKNSEKTIRSSDAILGEEVKKTIADHPQIKSAVSKLTVDEKVDLIQDLNNLMKEINESVEEEKGKKLGIILDRFGIGSALVWSILGSIGVVAYGMFDSHTGYKINKHP